MARKADRVVATVSCMLVHETAGAEIESQALIWRR